MLYFAIWQHCSTTPMRKTSHSRMTGYVFCQTNTKSCQITNSIMQILLTKMVPKFCNIVFFKRFTLTMNPILLVILKLIQAKFKILKWGGRPPQKWKWGGLCPYGPPASATYGSWSNFFFCNGLLRQIFKSLQTRLLNGVAGILFQIGSRSPDNQVIELRRFTLQ